MLNVNVKNVLKSASLKVFVLIVCVCIAVSFSGCAYHGTEGEGHAILPFNVGFQIGGALAEGPTQHKFAMGKNANTTTMGSDNTTFNNSWKETGISKYENMPVHYWGPRQASSDAINGRSVRD